jgi:hypothetical protein
MEDEAVEKPLLAEADTETRGKNIHPPSEIRTNDPRD